MSETNNNLQLLRVNHSAKMTEAFETMLSDESLCDVSICCSGNTIKAHRVILAASSAYFKQILSSINGQTQYPIIFVNGIQMSDLEAMLEFMYRGEVTIPQTQLPSLVKSAEMLGVSGLCQLDPNAQQCLSPTEELNKSRTCSPTDSTTNSRRGRKRKKLLQKTDNEISSDTETQFKKSEENGDESAELMSCSSNDTKSSEKLAKSKLRSWTQQIAHKSHNKDIEESQMRSESESPLMPANDELQTNTDITEKQHNKKQILKENWRHSRARRPPLKFSEYTLPKGIQELKQSLKQSLVKEEPQKEELDVEGMAVVEVRPPSPRLTRGRSRVYSLDEQKVTPIKEDSIDTGLPSTSNETLNTCIPLTPITRSRKQTQSPSETKLKDNESTTQEADELPAKTNLEEEDNSQTRSKAQVKPQISNLPMTSLIKWRPKDPESTTTKLAERLKSSTEDLKYQYESIDSTGPPVYRCSYCSHSFRSKQNIIDHIRSVHIGSEDRYVCPLCGKQFKWKTSLNNHLNQCHPDSRPTPLRHFDKSKKSLP